MNESPPTPLARHPVEVAVESVEDACRAAALGADRIELGAALSLGGLTPSLGAVAEARARLQIPLAVLVRPRAGGFVYDAAEHAAQLRDVGLAVEAGADVIVIGCLEPSGAVDRARTAELVARARPAQVTFHRAFDLCADRAAAVELLVELGVERVLSSGGAPSAEQGLEELRRLSALGAGRLRFVLGGGVRASNAGALLAALPDGELHSSCAHAPAVATDSTQRLGAGGAPSAGRVSVDENELRALLQVADGARRSAP